MTDEEIEKYFKNISVDKIDIPNQLVFDGEVVYWDVY